MNYKSIVIIFTMLSLLILTPISEAGSKRKVLKIGVSDLNHFPHFNFNDEVQKGLSFDILEAFAHQNNYIFEYIVLSPVKLQNAMETGKVDFIYPDNPLWRAYRYTRDPNIFSLPLIDVVSSTFVTRENQDIEIEDVKSVAIPYGYSAVTWLAPLKEYDIDTLTTSGLEASVQALYRGKVKAADIEYNIGQYLQKQNPNKMSLVINKNLPSLEVGFHLSTIKHILVIERFSHFLITNAELINSLKADYNIKSYEDVYGQDSSHATKKWMPAN